MRTEGKNCEKQTAGSLAAAQGQHTTWAASIFTSLDNVTDKKHVSQEEQEDKSSTNFYNKAQVTESHDLFSWGLCFGVV